jgi:hypothetical protein
MSKMHLTNGYMIKNLMSNFGIVIYWALCRESKYSLHIEILCIEILTAIDFFYKFNHWSY